MCSVSWIISGLLANEMACDDDGLSTYGLAVLGAGAGAMSGLLVKAFKLLLETCLELVWFQLPRALEAAGWTAEARFGLWHLPWILGALFGVLVGTMRQSLPSSAVITLGIWVRELHGPRGSAEAGWWLLQLAVLGILTALSGAAVGPEPIVIIVPSVLCACIAQGCLKQPRRVVRVAALAGGAGGLSAFFGLPLASAFLVLEVPHVDGAEYAMEALPACVVASITGTLAGDSIWHPASLLGNSRFGFPGSSLQRPFGVGAILFAPFAGMLGGFSAHLLIACMKTLHWLFKSVKETGPWKHWQRRRIHVALFLGCIGAVNGALGIFYPSALWWGEDQLQAVLTRGCGEYTEMSDCVPLELPHWYEKLQSTAAVHASPGLPMSAQAMVGLGIVKLVMISICEAGGFVGGAIYPVAFLAGSFGSALGATPWIQSLGGQFVYLSTAAAMSTALSALLNTQLFGVLLVLVLQDNIPHGNVSSQIIALLTAVYVHYLLTRKCIPSQLRLMPSQKARQDLIYSDISASEDGFCEGSADQSSGDSTADVDPESQSNTEELEDAAAGRTSSSPVTLSL